MRYLVLLLMVLAATPGRAFAQQDEPRTMTWQGVERHYVVHRPVQAPSSPVSLVVALAGLTQSLASLHDWLPLDPVADQHGFAVAYPEAIGHKWSYWRGGGVLVPDHGTEEVDDVGFISAMVDVLVKEGLADPERVFVTGVSRGALMSWTLLCERADLFAAAAPISSAMTEWQQSHCRPSRPVPVIAVDGTDDFTQFYDGFIYPSPLPRLLSVPETMAFWWKLNGCTGETVKGLPHTAQGGRSHVELFTWTGCTSGGPVMLYRVSGGGHPPPTLGTNASAGHFTPPNHDIETSQVIWDAFAAVRPKTP